MQTLAVDQGPQRRRIAEPGAESRSTWLVPARTDLLMTTGNAGGTDIVVDRATTPGQGGSGAVRRDLPLDPDQIKDGKLAAAALGLIASMRPRQ
jgi:cytoskeleton protein RodZ